MRDDQVRRYARHILVPDIGGLGQTALLTSTATIHVEGDAGLIAAMFLAAGGVGVIRVAGASSEQFEAVLARGDNSAFTTGETLPPPKPPQEQVQLPPKPAWWPSAPGDDAALAYWRGALAATRWMAGVANG